MSDIMYYKYGKYTVNIVQEGIMPQGSIGSVKEGGPSTQGLMNQEVQVVPRGVGDLLTTQTTAEISLESRSLYQAVSGMFARIWAYIRSFFCDPASDLETTVPARPEASINSEEVVSPDMTKIRGDNLTSTEKLRAFRDLLRESPDVKVVATATQRRAGYDALPDDFKTRIDCDLKGNGKTDLKGINTNTDLSDPAILTAVNWVYGRIPSITLDRWEESLSIETSNKKRVDIMTCMLMCMDPNADDGFTRDVIVARVIDLFAKLPDALRNEIYEDIWKAVLNPNNDEQSSEVLKKLSVVSVKINGVTIRTDNADFGSLVFKANPYGSLVINGLKRWDQNYKHMSEQVRTSRDS